MMGDKTKGLYDKFRIYRNDDKDMPGEKHHGCEYFVLDLTHDKYAEPALRAYAASCRDEYPMLSDDLRAKAKAMRLAGVAPTLSPACGGSGHKDDASNAETFIADVRRFTEAVGCTTREFNVRQTALYIGLQLEEMAEKLEALGMHGQTATLLRETSNCFKKGVFDADVSCGDREAMLDADVDLAWVTIGSALSQGADVLGAMREVARANLDKIGPDGAVLKDENGKVRKPEGWRGPDIAPYVLRETAIPATVSYPMGSMGEAVEA